MSTFNEAERYLIQNWGNASLLESAMEQVRMRYTALFEDVFKRFQQSHAEFSNADTRYLRNYGDVGVGKPVWFTETWTSGFWLDSLRLETLISPEACPGKSISINNRGVNPEEAARRLSLEATKILGDKESRKGVTSVGKVKAYIWFPLDQSRETLLDLIAKADSNAFVKCMVEQLESLVRFAPIVDEILSSGKRKRR